MVKSLYRILAGIFALYLLFPSSVGAVSYVFQKDTGGTLTTGLQAYYQLEDLTDVWNGVTLTGANSPTFSAGKVSNGVNFVRASSQYASTTNTLSIDGGNMSIEAWVKVTSTPALGEVRTIAYQNNNTSKTEYLIEYFNTAGTLNLYFDRAKPGVGDQALTVAQTLALNTWYQVIMTYNGSQVEGFLDGVSIGTAAASGSGSANLQPGFHIGRRDDTAADWNGMMDEVGAWNKQLSATEISDLYNAGNGQTMVPGTSNRKIRGAGISR